MNTYLNIAIDMPMANLTKPKNPSHSHGFDRAFTTDSAKLSSHNIGILLIRSL